MRVLVFRHVPFEHAGLILPALEAARISCQYVDAFLDQADSVSVSDADGFIFMGGPMSANDGLGYIHAELSLIRQAVEAGKPVLGICLGAQLIAKALGARVYRNPVKEIGWFPIWWTPQAASDPLLAGLEGPETVFHWHGETFDLPDGAVWLARSERCQHQAFRVGENTYGFQFHLEVTPEMIQDWVRQDANSNDVRELEAELDPFYNAQRLTELSSLIFGRWADFLQSPAPPK
ncbi:MAG: gamma-glutamyl-gamma-aminobutyrate hydrolase family protein [Bryobacteraceae bacterium]|nr:gamma-glutamyl-gamma-aminobutyrate hydrolase family protein [Bryobacteraceae bacterium]